ncbi:TonB-dependent receptor [Rhodohalobacter sulfatireducens]|uniref:TonB-dependent receptor n=1 Tax=Rhodohalobacter sulfatireducens TaxID=2911366 RepID=A0ABS9KJ11_9BACT|nr:TonB-dependent receptor [Rhodohalobacter sulfatireducens]MCG2590811.1 TonB-dependent receptor [Rhodohalobacter sulfatireducens]
MENIKILPKSLIDILVKIMKRSLFLGVCMLTLTGIAHSQNGGSITGTVTSELNGSPLTGVNVLLEGTRFGTTTDADGTFAIANVPEGSYELQFSFIGYQEKVSSVDVNAGSVTEVEIELTARSTEMQEIIVKGRALNLIGVSESASQGKVGRAEFINRPLLRTGEVMETVPGLIASQHSGTGKANQFYLRGFNLDHGTDFAASLEGVPLNLRTHGHGQGYLDLNLLIPELVNTIEFRKGPYYAEVGDFATSGSADIELVSELPEPILRTEAGLDEYYRGLFANSSRVGDKSVLYALNAQYYNGPFDVPENTAQYSGVVKLSGGSSSNGYSVSALGYTSDWNSSDQIPRGAVETGYISRFGAIDSTAGGETDRYKLIANWWNTNDSYGRTEATVYASYYRLNLFSNFTYFLNNPERGDQFEQADRRFYGGARISHEWFTNWFGRRTVNKVGADLRHDQIFDIGLYNTENRQRWSTVRDDEIGESSIGTYFENETQWTGKLQTNIGLRADLFYFDVNSNINVNSGSETDIILSPKFNIVLGPWNDTEFYINTGLGYHSNDARGTTIQVDPVTRDAVSGVDPLVRSQGAEVGVRTAAIQGLQSSLTFFYLGLDSELVFVGDAGGTEASDASEHIGFEWANYYRPTNWLQLNLDVALTESRYRNVSADSDKIPNSIGRIITGGVTFNPTEGWFNTFRLRHFGPRPLIETGDVRSEATTLLNFKTGYDFGTMQVDLDMLNILNAASPDISYYYTSRFHGASTESSDIHFHPVIPRTLRMSITLKF